MGNLQLGEVLILKHLKDLFLVLYCFWVYINEGLSSNAKLFADDVFVLLYITFKLLHIIITI